VIPNENGRVRDRDGVVRGAYVTGWIKRGPTGIIGTNKKCARDTVRLLVEDARTGRLPTRGTLRAEEVAGILAERAANVVTYDGWKAIDRHERRAGELAGRPRVKLTRREDMLRLATLAARRA
jgi:ferredoxin--NADP+ reductase